MLFCPSLQKFGSLKAVHQIFPKPLYFGLVNPSPFNHSSEVMFSEPLTLGFLQLTKTFPQPAFFLSFFMKSNRGEKRARLSGFCSTGLRGNLLGHLFLVFSCLALVKELPRCIKRRINIFLCNCGCAAGLRVVQRSRKSDCLHTQGIQPQTQGCL